MAVHADNPVDVAASHRGSATADEREAAIVAMGLDAARFPTGREGERKWEMPGPTWVLCGGKEGRELEDWTEAHLAIFSGTLSVVTSASGGDEKGQVENPLLCAMDLESAGPWDLEGDAPASSGRHPWRIVPSDGSKATLTFASASPEDRQRWVCALSLLSGLDVLQHGYEPIKSSESPLGDSYECRSYRDGSRYTGCMQGGEWHGWGRLRHVSGYVYEGEWDMGEKHGIGRMLYKSGDVYVGEFSRGMRHGRGTHYTSVRHPVLFGLPQPTLGGGAGVGGGAGRGIMLEAQLGATVRSWRDSSTSMELYRGFFDKDLRHGIGIHRDDAAHGGREFRVEYARGKLLSKINMDVIQDEAKPHAFAYAVGIPAHPIEYPHAF